MSDVKAWQRTHKNHLGQPLVADGVVGPQTQWAMAIDQLLLQRQDIVARAIGQIGLVEKGDTNRHEMIDLWLRRCGATLGSAWCAAFASWCIAGAGPGVSIAGAQALGRHFPETKDPRPGDFMWYPTGPWQGHCGIVTGVTLSEVMTVEGNLRNAVRVARRRRDDVRFSRTVDDVATPLAGIPPGVHFEETRTSTAGTR